MFESFKKRDLYKWVVLAISFLLMLVFSISLQALPPIFKNIIEDIPFSNRQAGLLMSSYSILGIFIPFFVALLLRKFDLKRILIISLLAVIIGLIGFSLSPSYSLLLFNRLLSGAGTAVLIVLSPLLVTMVFDDRTLGTAMGIFNMGVPLGTVLAANLFGYLGLLLSWNTIIIGVACFTILVLLLVWFLLDLPQKEKEDTSPSKIKLNLGLSLWLLGVIWMIANGQQLAYTTFAPQFFQLSGFSIQKSSLLTSMIMLISIFLAPALGILIDKTNKIKPFILIGSIIIIIGFYLLTTSLISLTLCAILLGIGFSFIPVSIFSLLPKVVKPEETGMGLASITATSCLGITLGPVGFGTLLDLTEENFSIGFILLSIFSFISILTLMKIKPKDNQ